MISRIFIERPVLAAVVSIVITLAGLISLLVAFLTVCWQAVKSSRTAPAR